MDENLFTNVFKEMFNILFSYFYSNRIQPSDVEDLINETFSLAWKYRHSLRESSKIKPWIFSIAKNVLAKFKSDRKRKKSLDLDERIEYVSQKSDGSEEDLDFAISVIEKLPQKYKDVFILFYVEEKSIKEISKILGISEENCKVRLFRARKIISKIISEVEYE